MTPLEALNEIRKQIGNIHYFDFSGNLPRETSIELRNTELFTIIKKALIALEIIILTNADIAELKRSVDVQQYNSNHFSTTIDLVREGFDLLKEVFLND